jgi:glycosyltransferase involved in cell wall biosynthesis
VKASGRVLPHRDVLERVHGASVGVVCNLPIELNQAALPSKLFEYVALGIPVVSADLPAIREYFSPDEVLFFRAGDAHALATALREVATHPEAARMRAAAARRRYEEYRWQANAERYAALLERLFTDA